MKEGDDPSASLSDDLKNPMIRVIRDIFATLTQALAGLDQCTLFPTEAFLSRDNWLVPFLWIDGAFLSQI